MDWTFASRILRIGFQIVGSKVADDGLKVDAGINGYFESNVGNFRRPFSDDFNPSVSRANSKTRLNFLELDKPDQGQIKC